MIKENLILLFSRQSKVFILANTKTKTRDLLPCTFEQLEWYCRFATSLLLCQVVVHTQTLLMHEASLLVPENLVVTNIRETMKCIRMEFLKCAVF